MHVLLFQHAASKNFCLEVIAGSSCKPSWLAAPIPITIPIGPSGASGSTTGTLQIDILGAPCVKIDLKLPKCPANLSQR